MSDIINFVPGANPIASITSITSIIPSMILGIVLIIAWLPIIYLTEKNNKGNVDEYNLLLKKIDTTLRLTDIKLYYPELSLTDDMISSYTIRPEDIKNQNVYIKTTKIIKDDKNKTTETANATFIITPFMSDSSNKSIKLENTRISDTSSFIINNSYQSTTTESPDNQLNFMNVDDYIYLASFNKTYSTTIADPTNSNISTLVEVYSIPQDKEIIKIEGLKEYSNELDMIIYNYEFGPKEAAINTIKNRKSSLNTLQKWGGRLATFFMLFIGFSLLISPLTFLVNLGSALPGPLKLITIPGYLLLSLYQTLNIFGSFILTLLMTLFIWSLINHPIVSVLIGGLLIGLIIYFKRK